MTGTEIIEFLNKNISMIMSPIQAVVGSIFTAIFLRNDTSIKEFEKIKAGLFEDVTNDLLSCGYMTYTEFYKAKNFLSVAKKADEYYKTSPQDEPIGQYDFDWFIRFYDAVGNISDVEMQNMWAKILAGEIKHPSSYSVRTIETLKNLSKGEALLFSNVCQHCIYNYDDLFLPNYKEYLKKCDITFGQILYLDELGLIKSSNSLVLNYHIDINPKVTFVNDDFYIVTKANKKDELMVIKQYPLTSIGNELATLFAHELSNEDFKSFARIVRDDQKQINISLHKVNANAEMEEVYSPKDLL